MRRTPLILFAIAIVLAVAALNEGNLNHWGTTIILGVLALGGAGAGIWTLRDPVDPSGSRRDTPS